MARAYRPRLALIVGAGCLIGFVAAATDMAYLAGARTGPEMSGQWYGLIGIVLSVIGSIAVARLTARAQDRTATANADVTAGQLALQIARDAADKASQADRRLGRLEGWRRDIYRWWEGHEKRDVLVEAELEKLDPGALQGLPVRRPLPEIHDED